MKLLFDENLSPRLTDLLQSEYPDSVHVTSAGFRSAPDEHIWYFARDHNFIIVSKDNDFRQRAFLEGAPPKVIWVNIGNAGTEVIAEVLRVNQERVAALVSDPEAALLVLSMQLP